MRSRLLTAALTALLALGAAACDSGTSPGGGTVDSGADAGSTGEGFEDSDAGGIGY
jgi:hypothetical protein